MWSVCGYNILNVTKKFLLGFMHMFGAKLMYGGQKMGTMTVFWPTSSFHFGFTSNKYWIT